MGETLGNTQGTFGGRTRRGGANEPHPTPVLFLALECERPLAPPLRLSLGRRDIVNVGRGDDRGTGTSEVDGVRQLELRLPDRWVSSKHARFSKVLGKWVLEDLGSKNGTLVNGKPESRAALNDGDLVEIGHTLFLYRDALPMSSDDEEILDGAKLDAPTPDLVTMLPSMARELQAVRTLAPSMVSLILYGESGTGKEVLARALHKVSGRAGEFVAVNCGALPDTLLPSELFGHRKGAFSGATEDRPGLIRAADNGTLFLDEIGDLPPQSQTAFLRALQEKEVLPVGGTRPVSVDFRVVAATHRDLDELIESDAFRADLFARLSGYTFRLPPLRRRREDIGLLIARLLPRVLGAKAESVTISCEAARLLFRYDWPLNVRELEKVLATAGVLGGHGRIEVQHLPECVREPHGSGARTASQPPAADRPLSAEDEARKAELEEALDRHKGNVSAVARDLGKARMQIQRWIKRYNIDPLRFR